MESVRINLYCAETQKYFKSGGRWTSSPSLAFDFQKFNAAWTAAKCLKGCFDIVVQSGDQKVFVPVDETGRAVASRLMAGFDSSPEVTPKVPSTLPSRTGPIQSPAPS